MRIVTGHSPISCYGAPDQGAKRHVCLVEGGSGFHDVHCPDDGDSRHDDRIRPVVVGQPATPPHFIDASTQSGQVVRPHYRRTRH